MWLQAQVLGTFVAGQHAFIHGARQREAGALSRWLVTSFAGNVVLMKQLGDCQLHAQQWQQALAAYKAALDLHTGQQEAQLQVAQHAQQGEYIHQEPRQQGGPPCQIEQPAGTTLIQKTSELPNGLTLQACCAAAMYPQGGVHAEAAVHLVHCMLQNQQQQQRQDMSVALRLYAQVAADKQQWAPAASAAVRLLSQMPQDKQGARLLALAVQVGWAAWVGQIVLCYAGHVPCSPVLRWQSALSSCGACRHAQQQC